MTGNNATNSWAAECALFRVAVAMVITSGARPAKSGEGGREGGRRRCE